MSKVWQYIINITASSMKHIVIIATLVALVFPFGVEAKSSNQGKHLKNNPPYDCSVTKKPSAPKWLDQRTKKEAIGNTRIDLIWEDADRAHDVEIKWSKVGSSLDNTRKTGDDGDQKFTGLKKGTWYQFKVRGYSNCGKSSWTKVYKFLP